MNSSLKTSNIFEVIIIGGGPAGALCGTELQKRGVRTCIMDKSEFPREKLCGGLLTKKTIGLLALHCPDLKSSEYIVETANEVDFFYKNQKINTFKTETPFFFTERTLLDTLLMDNYKKNGGVLFQNARVRPGDINLTSRTLTLGENTYTYKVIIGADGCHSIMNHLTKTKRYDAFCLEGNLKREDDGKKFRVYFGGVGEGYGWYFPKKDHFTIGIGGENKNKRFKKTAETFFKEVTGGHEMKLKGALLPSGKLFSLKAFDDRVLLIGDAAGFTDPITGEGLYYALLSGIIAAESIQEVLKEAKTNFKEVYIENTLKIRRNIQSAYRLRKILFHPWILKVFMNALKKHQSFALFYLEKVISTHTFSYGRFIWLYFFKYKKYL